MLVNNAGVAWMGPALEMPLEALQAMLRVNVEGVFIVSRAVLPHMIARRAGSVVNLASWAGKTGNAFFAGYSASKFAVIGLTQALAREMAPHGIRVNAICPGIVVDTAMRTAIEVQQRQYGLPETAEREKSIPIGRVSVPEDVARVAAFLASDESSYMTGEVDQSLRRPIDGLRRTPRPEQIGRRRRMPKTNELYDQDFLLWTQEQATALRRAKNSNLPLDWDNLAEEIESLGKSDRRQLKSQIRRILRHLFKLEVISGRRSPCRMVYDCPRRRIEIEDVCSKPVPVFDVKSTPRERQGTVCRKARRNRSPKHGEPADAVWARLEKGGFTAEQVLGDWFPEASG